MELDGIVIGKWLIRLLGWNLWEIEAMYCSAGKTNFEAPATQVELLQVMGTAYFPTCDYIDFFVNLSHRYVIFNR